MQLINFAFLFCIAFASSLSEFIRAHWKCINRAQHFISRVKLMDNKSPNQIIIECEKKEMFPCLNLCKRNKRAVKRGSTIHWPLCGQIFIDILRYAAAWRSIKPLVAQPNSTFSVRKIAFPHFSTVIHINTHANCESGWHFSIVSLLKWFCTSLKSITKWNFN